MLRSCWADDHGGFFAFADMTGASPRLLFGHFGDARTAPVAPRLLGAAVRLFSHRGASFLTASRTAALRASFPCFVASSWLRHGNWISNASTNRAQTPRCTRHPYCSLRCVRADAGSLCGCV